MEDALALTVGVSLDITDSILNVISKSDRVFLYRTRRVASQIKETVDLDESFSFFGKIKALKTTKIAVILRAE